MTLDPIGFDGGDVDLYRYEFNQPSGHFDSTGLADEDVLDWILKISSYAPVVGSSYGAARDIRNYWRDGADPASSFIVGWGRNTPIIGSAVRVEELARGESVAPGEVGRSLRAIDKVERGALIGLDLFTARCAIAGRAGSLGGDRIPKTTRGFRIVEDAELQDIYTRGKLHSPPGTDTPTGNLGKWFYMSREAALDTSSAWSKEGGGPFKVIEADVPTRSITVRQSGIDPTPGMPLGKEGFFAEFAKGLGDAIPFFR
jgi:hypothetical protein